MRTKPTMLVLLRVLAVMTGYALADAPVQLQIDATDLPRRLLTARQTISLRGLKLQDTELRLWYPQWVQGSHAPGGPIQNLAGLKVQDDEGTVLTWRRAPGEVYQIRVTIPPDVDEIVLELRYICNQSSANSHGLDSFGSAELGIISPNTVLFYPDGIHLADWQVACEIRLPGTWHVRTALPEADRRIDQESQVMHFVPVSLETLIDSPIMAGTHVKTYDLVGSSEDTPPHRLHVFSEVESSIRVHEEVLQRYRRMVTQASRLFQSHPFPTFDILLATTNVLPRNGLEHQRSSLNVIPLGTLDQPDHLKDWDRMLVPHEYVHAWCGKYLRPQGMITADAHTPYDTELLWVYEGLTQYLGELLEVRSGLMTTEEYRWLLLQRLRWSRLQQGRAWRPLTDTAAASHLLRAGSPTWGHLRRDQDYYFDGALFWLEVDAILRRESDGQRSLDDFCRKFFACESREPRPVGYGRQEIVEALNRLLPYDWDGLIRARIERPLERAPMHVVRRLGYLVQFSNQSPEGPNQARIDVLDARDSLGAHFRPDGTVAGVILDSAADRAGLAPEMRILGIGQHLWSVERFQEALEATPVRGQLSLLTVLGDKLQRRQVNYDGGPRYFTLVRDPQQDELLEAILRPLTESP